MMIPFIAKLQLDLCPPLAPGRMETQLFEPTTTQQELQFGAFQLKHSRIDIL